MLYPYSVIVDDIITINWYGGGSKISNNKRLIKISSCQQLDANEIKVICEAKLTEIPIPKHMNGSPKDKIERTCKIVKTFQGNISFVNNGKDIA